MTNEDFIYGPRATVEAIRAGREIDKILVSRDLTGAETADLMAAAHQARIPVLKVPQEKLRQITRRNHQGVVALLSAVSYEELPNLVARLFEQGEMPFLVLLDGITDIRNFGAIARTCECAGVSGIVLPRRGSVTAGADAMKTSAGALAWLPVCRHTSIVNAVKYLHDAGFSVVAATEKSAVPYTQVPMADGPLAIVMGAEGTGISADVLRLCDYRAAIPQRGHVESLNVSVAAGIIIYEAVRQRTLS